MEKGVVHMDELNISTWIKYKEFEDKVKDGLGEDYLLSKLSNLTRYALWMYEQHSEGVKLSKSRKRNYRNCLESVARFNIKKGQVLYDLVDIRYNVLKISSDHTFLNADGSRQCKLVFGNVISYCMSHYDIETESNLSGITNSGKGTLLKYTLEFEWPSRVNAIRYLGFWNLGYELTKYNFFVAGYAFRDEDTPFIDLLKNTEQIQHEGYLNELNTVFYK